MPEVAVPRSKAKRSQRKVKQRRIKRYAKARDDVMSNGDIEMNPAGAVRSEVVDPAGQGSQPLPGLVGRAVRNGWATPDEIKPEIVDELVEIVTTHGNGMVDDHVRVAAARTLAQIDKDQWERDNPELAAKGKGGAQQNVQVNVFQDLGTLLQRAAEQRDCRAIEGRIQQVEQGEPVK